MTESNKKPLDLKALLRGSFTEKNGIFYFTDVPKDVEPSYHKDPTDKKSWSPWRKENYSFFKRELEGLSKDSVLLDIGAGEMQFRDILEPFRLAAIDFYPYPGVNVVCDLNKGLPFRDGVADILVLSNVLEHSAEPNALLAECFRVLKPGGVMFGAVPFLIDIHQRPYDFYRYTDMNLRYLLKKHGFTEIAVTPVGLLPASVLMVLSHLFASLIQRTKYSENSFVQSMFAFSFRALWKIVRVSFGLFQPLLNKCADDENLPHGYHFKAKK